MIGDDAFGVAVVGGGDLMSVFAAVAGSGESLRSRVYSNYI